MKQVAVDDFSWLLKLYIVKRVSYYNGDTQYSLKRRSYEKKKDCFKKDFQLVLGTQSSDDLIINFTVSRMDGFAMPGDSLCLAVGEHGLAIMSLLSAVVVRDDKLKMLYDYLLGCVSGIKEMKKLDLLPIFLKVGDEKMYRYYRNIGFICDEDNSDLFRAMTPW